MANTTTNATNMTDGNLIDPQVIADFVEQKLVNAIRFAPLCTIRTDLVGNPGSTLSFPKWSYIGDASAVNEAGSIGITNLSNSKADVTVSKIGKGCGYTDEAMLEGLGGDGIVTEAVNQIVTSIASKVDSLLLTEMKTATLTYSYSSTDTAVQNIAGALEKFGEDMDGEKVLLIPPSLYTKVISEIVPNTDNGANILHSGNVGQILGCQVVVSNRLTTDNLAFIVKPGAMSIVTKRDTLVEFDRNPQKQENYIFGSKIFAPYLYDESKIIKISL